MIRIGSWGQFVAVLIIIAVLAPIAWHLYVKGDDK